MQIIERAGDPQTTKPTAAQIAEWRTNSQRTRAAVIADNNRCTECNALISFFDGGLCFDCAEKLPSRDEVDAALGLTAHDLCRI